MNNSNPTLGDHCDLTSLVDTLRHTLRQTMATRLQIEWVRQHPGETLPPAPAPLTVSIDFRLLESLVSELARNSSQALCGVPLVDIYNLAPPDEKCGCAECVLVQRCPVCGLPAHAGESDDLDRHPACQPSDASRAFVSQMAGEP